MRFFWFCLLTAVLQPVCIVAQPGTPMPQANPATDLWLIRSQTITEDLIKDGDALSSSERAVLWAKLAQRWWRTNPEKARAWLQKAIEVVKDVPNKENPDERSRRLSTARLILQIITPLDQELSKQLVALLTDDSTKVSHDHDADGLIDAAIPLVDKDPQRAAGLGSLALRVGRPTQIAWLLFPLRRQSATLADSLFAEALEVGRQDLDVSLLNSLTLAAFPVERQVGTNVPAPPDGLRKQLLEINIAFLQANSSNPDNRISLCSGVSGFIAPVLPQFDRLLPAEAALARQFVGQCVSANPLMKQQVSEAVTAKFSNTVEDLLKSADESQDVRVRTVYQFRAAEMAHKNKDYIRALNILDNIDQEGRKFMAGSWEAYRWTWADDLALELFAHGEVAQMRQVLTAVPSGIQPFAKLAFVDRLPEARDKTVDPSVEFLGDARKGLASSTVPDSEKATWYLGLLKLTVKYQPADAAAVLKETIDTLNHATEGESKSLSGEARSVFLQSISRNLPASLIELDEYVVKDAIAHIDSADVRVQLRLNLLGACLARLRNLQAASQKPG